MRGIIHKSPNSVLSDAIVRGFRVHVLLGENAPCVVCVSVFVPVSLSLY